MASKRKAQDPANLTVEILKEIRTDLAGLRRDTNERFESLERVTNERFESLERATNERFESLERATDERFESLERVTNERFESLERVTIRGFEAVTGRLENLRDIAGDRWRDHEARITRLESHIEGGRS